MPQVNFAVFKVGGVCIGDTDVTRAPTVPMGPTKQGAIVPVRPHANVLKNDNCVKVRSRLGPPGFSLSRFASHEVCASIDTTFPRGRDAPKAVAERFVAGSYRL